MLSTEAKFSGSFCLSQRILGAVQPGSIVLPRSLISADSPPNSSMISLHCSDVEVSHQSLAGRISWLEEFKTTNPCCCPLTPIARISCFLSPMLERHSRIVLSTALIHTLGSCS